MLSEQRRSKLARRFSQLDADVDGDGRISEDEYVDAMEAGVLADPQNYDAVVTSIVSALFRALDRDGGGALDLEELTRLCENYEMSTADAQALLDQLDADGDGDGTLSLEEFLGSVRDSFYGDDAESIGKYIFAGAS